MGVVRGTYSRAAAAIADGDDVANLIGTVLISDKTRMGMGEM